MLALKTASVYTNGECGTSSKVSFLTLCYRMHSNDYYMEIFFDKTIPLLIAVFCILFALYSIPFGFRPVLQSFFMISQAFFQSRRTKAVLRFPLKKKIRSRGAFRNRNPFRLRTLRGRNTIRQPMGQTALTLLMRAVRQKISQEGEKTFPRTDLLREVPNTMTAAARRTAASKTERPYRQTEQGNLTGAAMKTAVSSRKRLRIM